MSQTRQPIHVFPKITLKFGFWGRVTVIIVILTVIASILLYYHGMRYKNRELLHYQEITQQLQSLKEQQVHYQSKSILLQQKVDSLESQLAQIKKQVQPLQKPYALIKQVQHYVDLAEQHLWLQHDSQSASQLLAIADELLQHYGNQQTLALRQA
ncbi:MAG TPA: uroporphyrinogen-III C-methyltransferase, partial [Agitococcus sp.]|nr:uroporphyrinogen-III C-methyltransferase [Agitococcus sp.]